MSDVAGYRAGVTQSNHAAVIAIVNFLIVVGIPSDLVSALRRQMAIDQIVVLEILPAEHAQLVIAVFLLANNVLLRRVDFRASATRALTTAMAANLIHYRVDVARGFVHKADAMLVGLAFHVHSRIVIGRLEDRT